MNNDKLFNFVQEITTSEENKNISIKIKEVDKNEADKLQLYTNLDLHGYTHEIDNYGIKHVFKQHGQIKTEENRGQIAITQQDFTLILDIIHNYDSVQYAGKTKIGRDTIKYIKQYQHDELIFDIFYIEEVRDGKKGKKLVMQTMYKKCIKNIRNVREN